MRTTPCSEPRPGSATSRSATWGGDVVVCASFQAHGVQVDRLRAALAARGIAQRYLLGGVVAISLLFVGGQVFISYAHGSDGGYVASLAAHLVGAGVSVWYDKEIITGDRWEQLIRIQIDTCVALIVVMTPEAQESDWVAREIAWAEKIRKPIFPLLLRGEVLFRLSHVQYDDVTGGRLPGETFTRRLQVLLTTRVQPAQEAWMKQRDGRTAEEPTQNAGKPRKTKYHLPRHWPIAAAGIAVIALAIGGAFLGNHFGSRSTPGGTATTSPGPTSTPPTTTVQCVGSTCLGKNPQDLGCGIGAQTLIEERLGPILIELRYSSTCQAGWGKITGAKVGDMVEVIDQNDVRRSAKVLQNNDKFTPMIPAPEGYRLQACVYTTENAHACTKEFEIPKP